MSKLYKVTITGWVVQEDFMETTPLDWGTENLVRELMHEHVQETLIDTIDETSGDVKISNLMNENSAEKGVNKYV